MSEVAWLRGVPWVPDVLTAACEAGVADAVNEVARGLIVAAQHDPTQVAAREAVRGQFHATVTDELVVCGFVVQDAEPAEPEPEVRPSQKGRGPRSYGQLVEWLADEGYPVVATNGGHQAVLGPNGAKLYVFPSTPSDSRSLRNSVADLRRILGISLRRCR